MSDPTHIARLFHETYERLAPSFGYETRKASAVPWDDVPESNRRLMIAVAAEVQAALSTTPAPEDAAWAAAEVLREHQRSEVGTPDDVVDVSCSRCYLFDEGWPCNAVVLARAMLSHEARS